MVYLEYLSIFFLILWFCKGDWALWCLVSFAFWLDKLVYFFYNVTQKGWCEWRLREIGLFPM